MKQGEKDKLLQDIWERIYTKGMPVNVRNGVNSDIADYLQDIVDDYAHVDEPVGVLAMNDYDACPKCFGVIGNYAKYCKKCGAFIRI